jgi:hypothetical protein
MKVIASSNSLVQGFRPQSGSMTFDQFKVSARKAGQ